MSTPTNRYTLSGVHGVNLFLWDRLSKELGWDKKNYGNRVPIITPQQDQGYSDSGFPYIVYNYRMTANGDNYWLQNESVAYIVYGDRDSEIRQALNLIRYYFSSFDESAAVVNDFIRSQDDELYKEFHYHSISTPTITGASASDQEGGNMDSSASLFLVYARDEILGNNVLS